MSNQPDISPIVAHCFPVWLPQTQTWMYNQVAQLERIGVSCHVICEQTENLQQFQVADIQALTDENRLLQVFDKGLRKLRIRRHLEFICRAGKRVNANLLHSHFGNIGWTNLGAVRRLGIPHVVTFYGLDVNQLPAQHSYWRKRYQTLFADADLFLCEGSNMAKGLIELGCSADKIRVQHLGVDLAQLEFRPRSWQPGEELRVLIAASFREKKGVPYAIEALGVIAKEIPLSLTIIGDAAGDSASQEEKERILSALEKNGLTAQTKQLGYQTHSTMLQEAYDHHLFLQPSVTASTGDTEGGAPVAIIEMIASGMPVISTLHCDIPEVMGDGYTRFLSPERDIESLVLNIRKILEEADSWPGLLAAARQHIETEYDLSIQATALASHYRSVLDTS